LPAPRSAGTLACGRASLRTPAEIREAFSSAEELHAERPFYLVGIGGAGMSALAHMLQKRGFEVAGSDSTESSATASLREAGIRVRIGHSGQDVRPGHQVVLSDAIDLKSSPEVRAAQEQGCDLFRRSQLLAWLLRGKKTIAVTGTHGKTTVTGMIGAGLRAAGMDPTIVVGAYVPDFGGAVVEGEGEWAVVEACEAYNALLDLEPFGAIVTNLEPDHLDFHGSYESLLESVRAFLRRVPAEGFVLFDASDRGAAEAAAGFPQARPYEATDGTGGLPGAHNARNAAGAILACELAGADPKRARQGVLCFSGAERRLQEVRSGEIAVVDDYAHHPTEVKASLQALRERFPERRLVIAFQPHLYSRTAENIEAFAEALDGADRVVLTDIYPAREPAMPGVSSARIADAMLRPPDYVPSRRLLARHMAQIARRGDVLCMMGAGNIGEHVGELLQELDRGEGKGDVRPLRVAVLLGGDSAEREVSLHSGKFVLEALRSLGHEAFPLDVTETLLGKGELKELIGPKRPDLAFLAVHGTHAEDGAIQGLLELLEIPYTGSGLQASAIAMDKQLTKTILRGLGIPVPQGVLVADPEAELPFGPPLIVKPNAQGSTVGLSFVHKPGEVVPAIEKALRYDSAALVEEWVQGMEISVPVLGGQALPPVEICPKQGQYDFANKYLPGATEEICPARLPQDVSEAAQAYAVRAHRALGCQGATRTDFIVRDNREPVVLEVNTLPGLTGTSLLPNSALAAGMSFAELVEWIVQDALARAKVS
jgi:D-alanine--D-alanine ligase